MHGVRGTLHSNRASAAHGARPDCTSAKPFVLSDGQRAEDKGYCNAVIIVNFPLYSPPWCGIMVSSCP